MAKTQSLLIAIDGPAGAGKTTLSKMLAATLDYRYLDTGALYRTVALAVHRRGVGVDDDLGLEKVCADIRIEIEGERLILGGEDVSALIRTPEISMLSSAVSARPVVRKALLHIQRNMGRGKRLVAEGRDMGTVVFPEADIKFFLDASLRQRALRRFAQYENETERQSLEKIEEEIRLRDENDSSRDVAPLRPADDAIIVDSTTLPPKEVLALMLSRIQMLIGAQPS